jgi:hypothetical protein
MIGLRGSQLVALKNSEMPFGIWQIDSEVRPGVARFREAIRRRRRVSLGRCGSGLGRQRRGSDARAQFSGG